MNIATVLFTYNRSFHTESVLEALRKNIKRPEKLYIFQDGVKCSEHKAEWEKVNDMITHVTWCESQVIVSEQNKGLADSIVSGINYVLESNDALIVLEDDCVPHPCFMTYMYACLSKYAKNREVFSISGSAWNVDVEPNGMCAYFAGRISSWGWATWKDRWKYYKQDYKILARMSLNEEIRHELEIWGGDLESMLLGNVKGKCNSWAVFWALHVIEQRGVVVTPYQSLIKNIGMDGTGVHCADVSFKQYALPWDQMMELKLPDSVEFPADYKNVFRSLFARSTAEVRLQKYNNLLLDWMSLLENGISIAEYMLNQGISKISIWGKGVICDHLIYEVKWKIQILSVILSRPESGAYQDIPLVSVKEIPEETELIVVIPIHALEQIGEYAANYVKCRIIGIDQLIANIKNETGIR